MGRNLIIVLVRKKFFFYKRGVSLTVFEREKNPIKDKCPGLLFGTV